MATLQPILVVAMGQKCEMCGREPAVPVWFKAHQGFAFLRSETLFGGVLCRDHAAMARTAARRKSLLGMWFSPASILFGTLRLLLDSMRPLPREIKDEPWVNHLVACPRCSHVNFAPAGRNHCERCSASFAVLSCANCGAVQVSANGDEPARWSIECGTCRRGSSASASCRNWPALLVARAFAEAGAEIAIADSFVDPREREVFRSLISASFGMTAEIAEWLYAHFEVCLQSPSQIALQCCLERRDGEFVELLWAFACSVAAADGSVNNDEIQALRKLAALIGLDPDVMIGESDSDDTGGEDWWSILEVAKGATQEQIDAAYRALARRFHPDLFHDKPEAELAAAVYKMKAINLAYTQARKTAAQAPKGSLTVIRQNDSKEAEAGQIAAEHVEAAPSPPTGIREPRHDRRKSKRWQYAGVAACIALPCLIFWRAVYSDGDASQLAAGHARSALVGAQRRKASHAESIASDLIEALPVSITNSTAAFAPHTEMPPKVDPDVDRRKQAQLLYTRAAERIANHEYEDAVSDLTSVISILPKSAQSYHYRACAYEGLGRYPEALNDIDVAISLRPQSPIAFHARSAIYEHLGRLDEALRDMESALRLSPNDRTYSLRVDRLRQKLAANGFHQRSPNQRSRQRSGASAAGSYR